MRLRSALLDSLGHSEARFHPLELGFTDDDRCVDTVTWLDNGGGKTSLSSLLFSVLDPDKRNFIAHLRDKKYLLEHYVLTGDTGHVALRWDVTVPRTLLTTPLVTGQVLEWKDRQASVDDGDRLQRWFYGFTPNARLDVDRLPTRDPGTHKLRGATTFLDELRRACHGARIDDLVVSREQAPWKRWLDEHWLDTTLLHQQVIMNGEEGGAAQLFKFGTVWDFADLLLRLLADEEALGVLTEAVVKLRDKFAQQRIDRADLGLCKAVVAELGVLADARDTAREAGTTATRRLAEAATLRNRLDAVVAARHKVADAADRDADEASDNAQRLAGELDARDSELHQVRWVAATLRLADVKGVVAAVERQRDDAAADVAGWELVPTVLELAAVTGDRERLGTLLATANEQVDVRRRLLDQATGRYADRLAVTRHDHLARAVQERERASEATRRARAAREAAEAASSDLGRVTTALAALDADEAAADAAAAAARGEGLVGGEETSGDALGRWQVARGAADKAYEAARGDHDRHRGTAGAAAAAAEQSAREAAAHRDQAAALRQRIEALDERHAALEADPTLLDAGAGVVDAVADPDRLVSAVDTLREQLQEDLRHASRDVERLAERLAELDGNTVAIDADVRDLLATLHADRVPSVAGWAYLAEVVDADRRLPLLMANPAAVTGILLTSDKDGQLERARTLLETADPSTAITVTTTAALHTDGAGGQHRFVVTPSAERYDPDAAAALRARLTGELDAAQATVRRHGGQLRQVDAVVKALAAFVAAGGPQLPTLRTQVEDARRTGAAAEQAARAHREAEQAALAQAAAAAQAAAGHRQARDQAAGAVAALADAVAAQRRAEAARASRPELTRRLASQEAHLTGRRAAAVAAETEAGEHANLAQDATTRAGTILDAAAADAVVLPNIEGLADIGAVRALPDMAALRAEVGTCRTELAAATPDHELVHKHELAGRRQAELAGEIAAAHPAHVIRARELAESPQAQAPTGRGHATTEARRTLSRLDASLGEANAHLKNAETAERDAAPSDRRRVADLGAYPPITTPAEADTVLDRIEEVAQALCDERAEAFDLSAARSREAGEARHAAALFDAHARSIGRPLPGLAQRLGVAAPEDDPAAHSFTGTVDDAKTQVDTLVAALDADVGNLDGAATQVRRRGRTVADLADSHGDAHTELTARLASFRMPAHAVHARAVAGDLMLTMANLEAKLAEAAVERHDVIDRLADRTDRTLGLLERLERNSKIPDTIEEWAGKPFVRLRMTRPDNVLLRERVTSLVDGYLDGAQVPSTSKLNLAALKQALGEDGLTVGLLKPTDTMDVVRQPVEAFKASDGQQVTAAIMLYCTLARMRWIERGLDPDLAGGMLWLDNPFGKASKVDLVELQRTVAAKMGVQLLYLTAIKDLDAVSPFTRCNGLVKKANLRGRSFVSGQGEGLTGAALWRRSAGPVAEAS